MILYHVDRMSTLQDDQTIQLIKPPLPSWKLEKTLNELYPDGITQHGCRYLLQSLKGLHTSNCIEQIFELYRQLYFPDKPSRFQSFFCFVKCEQANDFYAEHRRRFDEAKILKIDTGDAKHHIGDMRLLTGETILQCHENAMNYWKGTLTPDSIQEVLVVPPVKVVGRLTP